MEEKMISVFNEINDEINSFEGDNLFEAGLLDSFQVLDLVAEIENAFDIEIDAKYVIEENFKSKNAMIALVKSLLGD